MEWHYILDVKTSHEGKNLQIELIGRLDTTTSPKLEAVLQAEMEDAEAVTFDMEQLEYISSAGLRLMLVVAKQIRSYGKPLLKNVRNELMDVFKVSGFDEILALEQKG